MAVLNLNPAERLLLTIKQLGLVSITLNYLKGNFLPPSFYISVAPDANVPTLYSQQLMYHLLLLVNDLSIDLEEIY